ncbi:TetR/AcrR family transcriptional regulator [Oceanidesulfovibrio marinus]|uniref:TetR/AcrR family transcriptional regulator n=1 Tax=Oceanidesulfovibrio marinus TaxID=370038 RepID=A0A6P1ZIU5_9BACT|nr:TetR/AcrR family transcriptional regulator [Oceanidesulfovibrio marinus]QJT09467.1 TetR/AcrR family transcriptional regulator [Oceanidesulfovibrio marinus]TVM33694.1 TetR/AcrR family transcriptional regulator [Oceanidesulfovibrio marinus]
MPRTGLTSAELVEKAIDIATRNIRQFGLDKFRLTDVAKKLKVSHAALYNHFPDKAAVTDAISERWLNQIDAALESASQADLEPRTRLIRWFLTLHRMKLEKIRTDPELYKTFNMAVELDKPFVRQHQANVRRLLGDVLRKAVDAGAFPAEGQDNAVVVLLEATSSFHHPSMVLEHKDEDREDLLQQIVSVVFAGLANKGNVR